MGDSFDPEVYLDAGFVTEVNLDGIRRFTHPFCTLLAWLACHSWGRKLKFLSQPLMYVSLFVTKFQPPSHPPSIPNI